MIAPATTRAPLLPADEAPSLSQQPAQPRRRSSWWCDPFVSCSSAVPGPVSGLEAMLAPPTFPPLIFIPPWPAVLLAALLACSLALACTTFRARLAGLVGTSEEQFPTELLQFASIPLTSLVFTYVHIWLALCTPGGSNRRRASVSGRVLLCSSRARPGALLAPADLTFYPAAYVGCLRIPGTNLGLGWQGIVPFKRVKFALKATHRSSRWKMKWNRHGRCWGHRPTYRPGRTQGPGPLPRTPERRLMSLEARRGLGSCGLSVRLG